MPDFPADIELCRTGYSRNLSGDARRVTFDTATRNRRTSRRRGCTDTVCFICTGEQCQQLEAFHRLMDGSLFLINLPDWQGISPVSARFDSTLTIRPVTAHYEVTASLYLPEPDVIPADDLDSWQLRLIGVTDDTFGDHLHRVIHIVCPSLQAE